METSFTDTYENLISWANDLDEGRPVEWKEFCEQAGLPEPRPGTVRHAQDVRDRHSIRMALNSITRDDQDHPFEILSVIVADDEWQPDVNEGEHEEDRPKIRVLMKLSGNERLDKRLEHHMAKVKSSPRNMLKEMQRIQKDKNLDDAHKQKAKMVVKATAIHSMFTAKYLEKAHTLKRISDITAQRCLADAIDENGDEA